MIEIIKSTQQDRRQSKLLQIKARSVAFDAELMHIVGSVIDDVRKRGDAALIDYTARFDGIEITRESLRFDEESIHRSAAQVEQSVHEALREAIKRIRAFHERQREQSWEIEASGARLGQRLMPLDSAGLYVPGGTASYPSSVVMNVVPAQTAGVRQLVVATPPRTLAENPAVAAALVEMGVTEVYAVGGAQAIAALAYGTQTIGPVQKIFGPGNAYVVEAKRQVFGKVAIDLLPGPSEILVLADETANPAWIAADLLAQAEHGKGSSILFLTDSPALLTRVESELQTQLRTLTRQEHLAGVIEKDCALILAASLGDAIRIANDFAPEHLSIVTAADEQIAAQIRTSGAIFLGGFSPVAAGDFLAGPSHTLPTGGAGKCFPGLMADMFQRRTSIVRFDQDSLRKSIPTIAKFSDIEGLDAHGRSATIRFE